MMKLWHIYVIIINIYATNKKYVFERDRENAYSIVNLKLKNLNVKYIFFYVFIDM